MGAILNWAVRFLAGWKAVDLASGAKDSAQQATNSVGSLARVGMSVGAGAGSYWLLNRTLERRALGGGSKRDIAIAAMSLGIGVVTYRATKSDESPGVAGDLGCHEAMLDAN